MARKKTQTKTEDTQIETSVDEVTLTEVETLTEAPTEAIESVVEETNTEVAPEEETPQNALQSDLEGVVESPKTDELFINVKGRMEPATKVILKETNLNTFVDKILFAAYLGGDKDENVRTRMDSAPLYIGLIIPTNKLDIFNDWENNKIDTIVKDKGEPYNISVSGINGMIFLNRLLELGDAGARVADFKKVVRSPRYSAVLTVYSPVDSNAHTRYETQERPIYTLEQLNAMTARDLKVACNRWKIDFRGKTQSKIDLVERFKRG